MRVYKCGCAASLEWCQNTKSHADMKNSWREMLLQWAYQKSHYHHVQCVYCKIWIFIMLLGRRYFELSPPPLTQCLFVCFTPFKFDLGQRITTDTHSRRESRLCANSSPILYHSILIRQRWWRRRRRRVNFYLLFFIFLNAHMLHNDGGFRVKLRWKLVSCHNDAKCMHRSVCEHLKSININIFSCYFSHMYHNIHTSRISHEIKDFK